MNAAFLVPRVSRAGGGVAVASAQLAKAICALGVRLRVHTSLEPLPEDDATIWGKVALEFGQVRGPMSYGLQPGLSRRLKGDRYDLVHLHGLWTYMSLSAMHAANANNLPLVVSPHGMLDGWARANSAAKKRLVGALYERRMILGAQCLHALCAQEADAIREYGYSGPIAIIPNGVELPSEGHSKNVAPWRDIVPKDARILLFLGRIHPKKGLSSLINGFNVAKTDPSASPWHLVIAGWDQRGHQAELELLAATKGLSNRVHFVGPQFGKNKTSTLRAADAFALPSQSEGLPMTILEAWAEELVVLMTPACNLEEGFLADAAIRIDTGADSVARGLIQLFSMSRSQREQMSANAFNLVKKDFDWAVSASKMVSVYQWLLGDGPRPDCVRV